MAQWIKDNQTWLLLAWPVLSAAFSLLYTQLESMPRIHAALSFLAGFGIDLPTIWDAIGRLLKGNPPNSSGGGRGSIQEMPGPQFKIPKAPPENTALRKSGSFMKRMAGPVLVSFALSCTPAQQATWTRVEQIVLDDLAAGKTRQQIEADVGIALAGQVGADIAQIVDEAIVLLIDVGAIPTNIIPIAKQRLAEHHKVTP